MKKLFTFFAVMAALSLNAQTITVDKVVNDLANDYSSGCEIDINNDGLKEIIFGGSPNANGIGSYIYDSDENEIFVNSRAAWLLQWDGTDYKYSQFSDYGVFGVRGDIIPCDFNGDGYCDIYIAAGGDEYTLNGIYINDGNGGFVKDESFLVVDEEGNPVLYPGSDGEPIEFWDGSLVNWLPRNVDIADFNCDGLPDIVSCGWWSSASSDTAMNGVLLNNGDGTYTLTNRYLMGEEDNEKAYAFALSSVKAYDLTNDGYPEILVQGNVDNASQVTTKGRSFMVFVNIGEENEPGELEFYDLGLADGVSFDRGNGNIVVADYNNDGVPDIFITGENPYHRYGYYAEDWVFWPEILYGSIDRYGEPSYRSDQSFVAYNKDIRPLNTSSSAVRAIDYNGDGYVDLLYPGWCTTMLDSSSDTQAGWFLPGSESGFTTYVRIPGASEHSVLFLDYGVEGDLNYAITGFHGDLTFFDESWQNVVGGDGGYGNRSLAFTTNPWTIAGSPDAPTNPTVEVDGNTVTLSWSPAASSMNNVTYEYYLLSKGKVYNGCTSFIGGDMDGVRKVLREGNAWQNTTLTLTLPDGTYDWGVQTINAALKGSTFANGAQIIVGDGGEDAILNVEANVEDAPAVYYNVAGQRVSENYKGVVVVNGKKVLNQ